MDGATQIIRDTDALAYIALATPFNTGLCPTIVQGCSYWITEVVNADHRPYIWDFARVNLSNWLKSYCGDYIPQPSGAGED